MTRRERDILKASVSWTNKTLTVNEEKAFQAGAKWADKTMIEKAREWFNLHFRQVGTPREIKHDFESKERMWKSFTQFMEE